MRRLGLVTAAALSLLGARAYAQAPEPWIGRWSIDPAGCAGYGTSAATSPLVVTDRTLDWFASSCRIGKLYKTGQDAHIQAHCSAEGVARDTPVSLKPHGAKMLVIWDNRPVGEMQKCR